MALETTDPDEIVVEVEMCTVAHSFEVVEVFDGKALCLRVGDDALPESHHNMFMIHATKKLGDHLNIDLNVDAIDSTTRLGGWYANRVYIRPKQHVIFVNETTLLPVVIPIAPAKSVESRFVLQLCVVLRALGVDESSIAIEAASMTRYAWTKTASRSVVGSMTDFIKHIEYRADIIDQMTLTDLALELARTPCRAGRSNSIWPEEEARNLFA